MARKIGLRWTGSLSNELKREIKNYNARLRAAEKRGIPKELLPSRVTFRELSEEITTKRQYNSVIKTLRFATAKNLQPTGRSGKSKFIRNEEKKARARKTEVRALRFIMPEPKPELSEEMINELHNMRSKKSYEKFPTESEVIADRIGLNKEGDAIDTVDSWIKNNIEESSRWKESYLSGIRHAIEIAMMRGDYDAIMLLSELEMRITKMDLRTFLLGQLIKPDKLEVRYIYNTSDGEWSSVIENIITQWQNIYR